MIPVSDETHLWIGDARYPGWTIQNGVLCFAYDEERFLAYRAQLASVRKLIHVSILKPDITCQACLELIHA